MEGALDYGYRAVHASTLAAKWILRVYYGRLPDYSYFDGCSNGGRQALIEAQARDLHRTRRAAERAAELDRR